MKKYIEIFRRIHIAVICAAAIFTVAMMLPSTASAQRKSKSEGRSSLEQLFEKAEEAYMLYRTQELMELNQEIELRLDDEKSVSKRSQDRLRRLQSHAIALCNMLGRVEQIVIVDSVCVPLDPQHLFAAIPLSPETGSFINSDDVSGFSPAGGREIFYTETDSAGRRHIMHAGILDDGTRDTPERLKLFPDATVETAYPFLMADGSTLYFAAVRDGDNAIGNMDIYMTRRDDEGNFYEPTNIGMPYNSPGNDYLMVVDETAGLGFWVTDRAAEDGMATVYTFVPNATRINYQPDRADIGDLAFITDVAATQPAGFDAQAVLKKAAAKRNESRARNGCGPIPFTISLGDGRIFTDAQMAPAGAQKLINSYKNREREILQLQTDLAEMRQAFADGQRGKAGAILAAEQKLSYLQRKQQETANQIVQALQ